MDYLVPILASLARQLPMFIVVVVGISMAASRRETYPRAASLLTLGGGIYLGMGLLSAVFFAVIPAMLMENGMQSSSLSVIYTVAGVIISLVDAGALSLIIAAVFAERRATAATPGVRAPLL